MAQKYVDSFGTRKVLTVGSESYDVFRLDLLEKAGFKNILRLPVSLKVLLENLLRQEDNHHVDKPDIEALARCIRLCLDCADACVDAGRILSRQTDPDADTQLTALEACLRACRACAAECERHAHHHEHCRLSAEECRRCERACDDLLAALGRA